jgi:hypothetical protein
LKKYRCENKGKKRLLNEYKKMQKKGGEINAPIRVEESNGGVEE